jgi:transcription factor CRZ1
MCINVLSAFARAFNLKTHRETHNPNRAKPHACPFPTCGRSFSRKHDLGRHLISIHRVDPADQDPTVGVQRGSRSRCESCGKSWVGGKGEGCDCDYEVR